jgi:hypothetical protein
VISVGQDRPTGVFTRRRSFRAIAGLELAALGKAQAERSVVPAAGEKETLAGTLEQQWKLSNHGRTHLP